MRAATGPFYVRYIIDRGLLRYKIDWKFQVCMFSSNKRLELCPSEAQIIGRHPHSSGLVNKPVYDSYNTF